jgi:hypothetical protein
MSMLFGDRYWGVDSYAPAYRPGTFCLYDQVVKVKKPAFWGRYIRCPNAADPNALTGTERDFLLGKGCAIVPIYNRTVYQRRGPTWASTFADGVADAVDAITVATGLGIPTGVYIYADIEPGWPNVSTAWILGWWCTFYPSPYWGALYCTLQQKYCNALAQVQSLEPPPNLDFIDLIRWCPIPEIMTGSYVWSFSPYRGSFTLPPAWQPLTPPCHPDGVKLWQYCANHLVAGTYVDADLATGDAYAGMWQPAEPLWQS